ncbi:TonB-dependent receptor domain-containing protein [Pseudarcicella hirudinis]|uniref:TonB-dependent receptor domain-containing protein n=1 Tax=Pseudarcicella hirudinis TaxID=1079859 RepID=UPI0035E497F3
MTKKKMGKDAINAVVGYSYQKFENYSWNHVGYGGTNGEFNKNLGAFKKQLSWGDSTKSELQSYFGRVNYSIGDKYFLTGTLRVDGSTKFGTNNKYGYFPAFAGKWKIGNENFVPKSVFNDLAVRLNWGQTGNQEFPGGIAQAVSQHNYNGSDVPINAANPNIKWETTTTYGAGLDFAILDGRLSGSVDYFNKSTTDLLFLAVYAQPAAVKQRWVNLPGNVRNTGVEVGLNFQAVQAKSFTWEVLYNMTFLKNTIENFGSANINTGNVDGQGLSGAYAQRFSNGYALYSFYLPTFTGLDANGLGTYADNGASTIVGNPIPSFTFGFTNNFTFGKFNASLFFNGSSGFYLYNNTANALFLAGSLKTGHNVSYDVLNSNENPLNAGSVSTRFLEKGDFIRLANASVGYTFDLPASSKIKTLRVSLTGQNMFVITNYSGLDPEVNTNKAKDGVPSRGMDYTAYPKARTFTLGLNLGF